jgi:hypothetical protein
METCRYLFKHCVLAAPLPRAQVAQAGLLAQRDSLSPFRVVLATSLFSLLGDWLLIGRCGMGVAGAAWTTILAQASGGGGGDLEPLEPACLLASIPCLVVEVQPDHGPLHPPRPTHLDALCRST